MAKAHPIVPAEWVDGLSDLNASLLTYQLAVEGLLRHFAVDGVPARWETVIAGLDNLFQPVLSGYQDIQQQIDQARALKLVGIVSSADSD